MANRKFSAFTAGGTNQVPTDVLVGLDLSLAANAQNTKWTLNNLFAVVTRNITDGALRFGGFAAPAVSGAGEGSIYFDSTSNTFKISQNAGAYANIGNVSTTGFTATRVPIANGANTLTDDAGLTFNTTTNILSVGETTGGGVGLVGSNGNSNVLASQAPAATLLTYWPNAAPTAGQFLYAATVGAQVQLGYQTAPSGSGSANQIAVWGASNALTGSSALTFTSGVVSITGTTNPGVVITGSAATESGITVNQSVSGAAADAFHSFQTPSTTAVWRLTTAGFTPTGLIKANQLDTLGATGTVEMLWRLADASTRFVYGVNDVEAASINATSTLGLVLGAASTLTGRVRMYNSAGTTYSQISAGNAGSSLNFIWPVVNPTAGQVLSASAPSGSNVTLSWIAAGGSAALTATQVGFGDGSNVLSGSADFTYTTAAGQLSISKTVNGSMFNAVTNGSNGAAAQARFGAAADVAGAALAAYSSGFTTSGLITANTALLDLDGTNALIKGQTGQTLTLALGNTARTTLTDAQLAVLTAPTTGAGLSVAASTVTTGNLVSIAMTGTAAASNTKTALSVTSTGANGTASQTVSAASFSCTNTGTTNTNVALTLTASGAATANTALNVTAGAIIQTSNLAVAFASGPNGATNPVFQLVNSAASSATGISVTGAAAGSGVTLAAISSGTNETVSLSSKGSGAVSLITPGSGNFTVGTSTAGQYLIINAAAFRISSSLFYGISSASDNSTVSDTILRRNAAANWQLGNADAAAPVAQTLSVQNVVAGTTDTAGANWTFAASRGTGTGNGGSILFQTAPAGSTGSSQNALATALSITSAANVGVGTSTFGTSAARVFSIATGTAPSTSPADAVQIYSADAAAGDAQAFVRNEAGDVARLTGTLRRVTTQFDVTSSTTLAGITGLSVNVEAGVTYKFEANIWVSPSASGGTKIGMNGGTATATAVIFESLLTEDTSTFTVISSIRYTALNNGNTAVGGTGYCYRITGSIVVNAAGTFFPSFAQAVSNGTPSSVLVGSTFQIWQV